MTRPILAALILLALLLAFGLATAPPAQTVRAAAVHEPRHADPTPAPAVVAPTPAPTGGIGYVPKWLQTHVNETGIVSWADEALDGATPYLALSWWQPGTVVEITGPNGSVTLRSNDVGPIRSLGRLADIPVRAFELICYDRSFGLCTVNIRVLKRGTGR